MTEKTTLRAQLRRAWKTTIEKRYQLQLINSEHGLQAYFCAALMEAFDASGVRRHLFIEPKLTFSGGSSRRHPDIVICNTKNIVGIVELKYVPRGRPSSSSYKKDIKTLELAVTNASDLKLTNDRFRGVTTDNKAYPLAENAVLCWAGVYAGKEIEWQSKIDNELLRKRFLQLSARTIKDSHPTICLG